MIRYALSCDNAHDFESWFQSAEAFDRLLGTGHVACTVCGSAKVEKSLMAPAIRAAGSDAAEVARRPTLSTPTTPLEQAMTAMRRHVEENSEYVGMNFASEARAIHDGDAPTRSIYGETRGEDARKLIEDGIPVAPLPFLPTRRAN